jgi:hypothetical protein
MHVKTVGVLLLLTGLVGGVAVNGSRAQPLPGTSVAFQHCLQGEPTPGAQCRSLNKALVAMEEIGAELAFAAGDAGGNVGGEVGGDVAGAGEDFLRDLAVRALEVVVVGLARALLQALIRGTDLPVSRDAQIDTTLFDPAH